MIVPKDLESGKGDGQRIAQVILNLLGNAIKFTDQGVVKVEVALSNESFLVSVSDTGPGLSETDQVKIFGEFQQADGSSTSEPAGIDFTEGKIFMSFARSSFFTEHTRGLHELSLYAYRGIIYI